MALYLHIISYILAEMSAFATVQKYPNNSKNKNLNIRKPKCFIITVHVTYEVLQYFFLNSNVKHYAKSNKVFSFIHIL